MNKVFEKIHLKILSLIVVLPMMLSAADKSADATVKVKTLEELIAAGGPSMMFIIALSVIALFLIVFYLLTLRSGTLYPKAFITQAGNIAAEGDADALAVLCKENGSAAAKIIATAANHVADFKNSDYVKIRDVVEEEGARQAGILWHRIQYLQDIAVVAPMIGLLGTVLGMLQAFTGFGVDQTAQTLKLASGVSQAMITTAGGLIVGITCLVVYSLFRGYVNRLVSNLEMACTQVIRNFHNNQH